MLTTEERDRVRAPLAEAWTLPPQAYTDPAVWAVEVEQVFRRDWVCVARVEQVGEARAQLPVDVAGQPVVLTNPTGGADGIRALANVCLHRAMPLVAEPASGRHLTCPYHLWSYDLGGRLRTAPLMEGCVGFDVDDQQLPEIPVEVWEGFVFVCLAPEPEPLAPQLEPLRRLLADHAMGDLVIGGTIEFDSPWNWKLLVENFMEAYHHIGPHRRTFQPIYPAAQSSVPDNEGGPWSLLRMPGVRGDVDGDGREGLPFLPGLRGRQRDELLAACVFPTMLVAPSSTLTVWYELRPSAHDEMLLRIHLLLPPETLARPEIEAAVPAIMDDIAGVHHEDIAVNEGPWRGLQAPLTGQGRLSPLERSIHQLNQLWLDRVDPGR
ncbi:MAG: aromatic ring-hydroxylating dioxygenase subunit alpha [Actinomycetota bacterium]